MFICFIAKKVDTDTPNSTAIPTIRKFHVPEEETKIELMLSDLKTIIVVQDCTLEIEIH